MGVIRKKEENNFENEEIIKKFILSIPDACFLHDSTGTLIDGNDEAARMVGYTRDELKGVSFLKNGILSKSEALKSAASLMRNMMGQVTKEEEFTLTRKDGRNIIVEVTSIPITLGGKKLIFCVMRDVTEKKKREEALSYDNIRFRDLFNNMHDCCAVYRIDDKDDVIFVDFNSAAEKTDKVKKEFVLGKKVDEIFPGVREFGLYDVFRRVHETGRPEYFPLSFYKDSRISGWRDNYVFKLSTGEIVAIYHDVTDVKQMEEKLRISEERYRIVIEETEQMIYDYNVQNGKIIWVGAVEKITGYTQKEYTVFDIKKWEESIHSDDRERVVSALKEAELGERNFHVEYRYRKKDGSFIVVDDRGTFITDKDGNPYRMIGVMADITRQSVATGELKKRNEELEKMNHLMVGRELKMNELKKRIQELEEQLAKK